MRESANIAMTDNRNMGKPLSNSYCFGKSGFNIAAVDFRLALAPIPAAGTNAIIFLDITTTFS